MKKFLTLSNILMIVGSDLLTKHDRGTGGVYHGRYTRDLKDSELFIPRRVFEDGSFDTYALPSFYDRREVDERRKKRSSSLNGASQLDAQDEDKLHLVLPFKGIDHHVELFPYHDFISPEMVIEARGFGIGRNLNEGLRFNRVSDQQCHYRGIVRNHDYSRAALSLCDGVVGYIQTNHGRYFVEPLHQVEPETNGQHVHIIYQKDVAHGNTNGTKSKHVCGTDDNWESAWTEQLTKRQQQLAEENENGAEQNMAPWSGTHSIHRYIELGLVADRKFLDHYKNENYEQYLLTIMNMVSDFYHDQSIGNQIDVVVVRIIYLEKEKEEIDLTINQDASKTLDSFSKWAEKMNPKDLNHPNHWDIAVLITRHDICDQKNNNCGLTGLAYMTAACDPAKAACINEENGLVIGIVVAHEVGHVMGCGHDDPKTSGCPAKDESSQSWFVMSPVVYAFTTKWSTCSKTFVTKYLESGLADCLNNNPRDPPEKFKYPNMLPGAMYDAGFQCQQRYPDSTPCSDKVGDCEKLWCYYNSSCWGLSRPLADGTNCGENKWCIHTKCVDVGTRPEAVSGGWGEWGALNECSRTCGGGINFAERECNNPAPANGGKYCIGERKKFSACNTTPCDPTQPTFRALQCSEFDQIDVLGDGLHTWVPYISPEVDMCVLDCINEAKIFVQLSPRVKDATPCKSGTTDMCIGGVCRSVGCDWAIDSKAVEDVCGHCNGDGTQCSLVEAEYTELSGPGYVKIVTIPKGATGIQIIEKGATENMLAVKHENGDKYCLNANDAEAKDGDYECAGTMLIYTHPETDKAKIEMKGPLSEDLQLQCVFYNTNVNPGIGYKFYVPSTEAARPGKYEWDFLDWSKCSQKCGGGTSTSEASCVEANGGKVSANFCDDTQRPDTKTRPCNQKSCEAKWRVSQWSNCNSCDGKKGKQHRKVQCVKSASKAGEDDVQANFDACKGIPPPHEEECVDKTPCKKKCPKKTRSLRRKKSQEGWMEGVGVSDKDLSTPKPGSIIIDTAPVENTVLEEVPLNEGRLKSNLSDKAFNEGSNVGGSGVDTSRKKVFQGEDAVKMIEKLTHRNSSLSSIDSNNNEYELS